MSRFMTSIDANNHRFRRYYQVDSLDLQVLKRIAPIMAGTVRQLHVLSSKSYCALYNIKSTKCPIFKQEVNIQLISLFPFVVVIKISLQNKRKLLHKDDPRYSCLDTTPKPHSLLSLPLSLSVSPCVLLLLEASTFYHLLLNYQCLSFPSFSSQSCFSSLLQPFCTMSTRSASRSSRPSSVANISDEQMSDLLSKLRQLIPQLRTNRADKVPISRKISSRTITYQKCRDLIFNPITYEVHARLSCEFRLPPRPQMRVLLSGFLICISFGKWIIFCEQSYYLSVFFFLVHAQPST